MRRNSISLKEMEPWLRQYYYGMVPHPNTMASSVVKVSITASHDGGNIELISISEPVISGRTAKVTVTVHIKPGKIIIICLN